MKQIMTIILAAMLLAACVDKKQQLQERAADYEVAGVQLTDDTHAVATILVRQKWEDGSFAEDSDMEEHKLLMEKVNGQWLISDFDDHKKDCIRYMTKVKQ